MLLAPLSYFAYLQAQALVDPLFKMALLSTPYRPEEGLVPISYEVRLKVPDRPEGPMSHPMAFYMLFFKKPLPLEVGGRVLTVEVELEFGGVENSTGGVYVIVVTDLTSEEFFSWFETHSYAFEQYASLVLRVHGEAGYNVTLGDVRRAYETFMRTVRAVLEGGYGGVKHHGCANAYACGHSYVRKAGRLVPSAMGPFAHSTIPEYAFETWVVDWIPGNGTVKLKPDLLSMPWLRGRRAVMLVFWAGSDPFRGGGEVWLRARIRGVYYEEPVRGVLGPAGRSAPG